MLFEQVKGRMSLWKPVLKVGSSGRDVQELQSLLYQAGYLREMPDGRYGILTEEAVQSLQKDYGLMPDGIVGRRTRETIQKGVFKNRLVHVAREGETLSDISDLFGVDENIIARSNNLYKACRLWEGQQITILKRAVLGMVSWDTEGEGSHTFAFADPNIQILDAVIFPLVEVDYADTLFVKNKDLDYLGTEMDVFLRIGFTEGENIKQLFFNKELSGNFAAQCLEFVKENKYGLCFDLGLMDEEMCTAFVRFLGFLRKKLGQDVPLGLFIPVQTVMDTGVKLLSHTGSLVDWIVLGTMAETGISPVPYKTVKQALARLVNSIPRWKIILRIVGCGVHVAQGRYNYVKCIPIDEVKQLARRYAKEPCWDQETCTYIFQYHSRRTEHTLWYPGVKGLKTRCNLINRYNIGGVLACYANLFNGEAWDILGLGFVSGKGVPVSSRHIQSSNAYISNEDARLGGMHM